MGLVFIDGFDDRTTVETKWDRIATGAPGAGPGWSGGGRTGPGYLNLQQSPGSGGFIDKCITPQTTYIVGFAARITASIVAGWSPIFSFMDSNSVRQLDLEYSHNDKKFRVENSSFTSAESAVYDISTGWFYLEFKCVVGASGSYEFRINGVTPAELSGTGVDTDPTGEGDIGWIRFWPMGNGQVDDFYILDTGTPYPSGGDGADNDDFIGPCNVYTRTVIGDSAYQSDFTPLNAGTNHDELDEIEDAETGIPVGGIHPDGDTTKVSSSTTGHQDLYDMGDLPPVTTVHGVQISTFASQTDTGTLDLKQIIGNGAGGDPADIHAGEFTKQVGSEQFFCYTNVWDRDPDGDGTTPIAWIPANVDLREFGFEVG